VPRGSFAIAGDVAGFYPIDSPGGWNLLGRTETNLEHAIAPGDVLAIEPTLDPLPPPTLRTRRENALQLECADVIAAPLARLVSAPDWSRVEHGVSPGGPFDDLAAAVATRAVTESEALIECAMTGPRLRFRREAITAWCGPDLDVHLRRVRPGEELSIGRIDGGLRGYLAIGRGEGHRPKVERGDRHRILTARGPHATSIGAIECEVTPQLDRVGIRLRPLIAVQDVHGQAPSDLRSCGMQRGTIQLHPDGSIVAMGPDHPITGGYLQPLTVLSSERWKLGQLMPGERVRLEVGWGHCAT
jgi:allophanate hydrolase subunit 2